MDPKGLRLTKNAYLFLTITHTKQLLLVKFCNMTAGNGVSFWTHEQTEGRTDERTDGQTVGVEIII